MRLWTVSGACRGIGKTWLCQKLALILPDALAAKVGHNQARAGKPGNYFTRLDCFDGFLAEHAGRAYCMVETNRAEIRGRAELRIFIGPAAGCADLRSDAGELQRDAGIAILQDAGPEGWRQALMRVLPAPDLVQAVFDACVAQQAFLRGHHDG